MDEKRGVYIPDKKEDGEVRLETTREFSELLKDVKNELKIYGVEFDPAEHRIELVGLRKIAKQVIEDFFKQTPDLKDLAKRQGFFPGSVIREVWGKFLEDFYDFDVAFLKTYSKEEIVEFLRRKRFRKGNN